jgi:DNA adenine methylase
MPETINPLRYPGAKRTLVNYIDDLLYANNLQGCCFIEPYAGSAVVGLELLQRESIHSLVLCEKDILIYAFWKSVFTLTDALCERILKTPITIETSILSFKTLFLKSSPSVVKVVNFTKC